MLDSLNYLTNLFKASSNLDYTAIRDLEFEDAFLGEG